MSKIMASVLALAAVLGCLTMVSRGLAEEPISPDQQKKADEKAADEKKKAEDAPPPVKVADSAKPVLEKMRDAYGKLQGLQLAGTWTAEWDVDGKQGKDSAEFTSSYAAPNKFRHEIKDDQLFGSTGEKVYVFSRNQYLLGDALKARGNVSDLPKDFGGMLKEKNPSLLLAMTNDETPFLAERATSIEKADDVKLDGASFTVLKIKTQPGPEVSVLVDPATNLMRQWSVDLKKTLEERGQQNVKTAMMTIDYKTVKPEAPAGPEAFAWDPPEGARDAAKMAASGGSEAAAALEGKDAPTFELSDLDGKKVALKDANKDHVIVLDFWATWCGPCRAGLPILDKVAADRKDKKLKVFAVNLEEEKAEVAAFVKETKLGLPVLLDSAGETGKAYSANAIPETVIIGKDGKIKKVMVGLHDKEDLEKAIDEALKG